MLVKESKLLVGSSSNIVNRMGGGIGVGAGGGGKLVITNDVATTSESDSNQTSTRPLRSSENKVFQTEDDKSENEFSEVPL